MTSFLLNHRDKTNTENRTQQVAAGFSSTYDPLTCSKCSHNQDHTITDPVVVFRLLL